MSPSPWRLVPARSAATCCCCCLAIAMLLLKPWECLASWALRLDVQCVLSLLLPWLLLLLLPCCCCRCCCCLLLFLPYHVSQRRSMHWLSLMWADAGISYHAFQRRSMHWLSLMWAKAGISIFWCSKSVVTKMFFHVLNACSKSFSMYLTFVPKAF